MGSPRVGHYWASTNRFFQNWNSISIFFQDLSRYIQVRTCDFHRVRFHVNRFFKGFSLFIHLCLIYFLATPSGMWDLSSPTTDWTLPPALQVWHLNPWTAREFFFFWLTRDWTCTHWTGKAWPLYQGLSLVLLVESAHLLGSFPQQPLCESTYTHLRWCMTLWCCCWVLPARICISVWVLFPPHSSFLPRGPGN